jgi:hypothetical protein
VSVETFDRGLGAGYHRAAEKYEQDRYDHFQWSARRMRQLALLPPRRMEFTGIAINMLPLGGAARIALEQCPLRSASDRLEVGAAPVSQASAPER